MSESLAAACGEFEQILLAGMLRSAGVGRSLAPGDDADAEDAGGFASASQSGAFDQLVVTALAGAMERAGGIGIARSLESALGKARS